MNFFDYAEQDFIPCEMCGAKAVDVHHIERRSKFGNYCNPPKYLE